MENERKALVRKIKNTFTIRNDAKKSFQKWVRLRDANEIVFRAVVTIKTFGMEDI
jgi:hypothetical protein